jgi:hypothetical protein
MQGMTVGVQVRVGGQNTGALRQVAQGARTLGTSSMGAARGVRLLEAAQGAASRGAGGFGRALSGLGGMARGVAGHIGGMTRSVFSLQGALTGIAAFAASGAVFNKLIGSNASLQSQQLGLAATIGANLEFVDSQGKVLKSNQAYMASMRVATGLTEQFEKAALNLPGSSRELAELFQGALNPSLAAGKSIKDIQRLGGEAMTFAKIMGNDIPQASRDLQGILSGGNIGLDNKTWSLINKSIGLTAEQFGKLPAAERFDKLSQAMRRFATPEIVKAFSESWDGLTSSLGDLLDQAARTVGKPVFKELSSLVKEAVGYLSDPKNKREITAFATTLGQGIAGGIRTAVNAGRALFKWFTDTRSGFQSVLATGREFAAWVSSLNFADVTRTGAQFWDFLVQLATTVTDAVVPAFNYFKDLFAQFNEYTQDGSSGAMDLTEGILAFAKGLATVVAYTAGFIALGLTVTIYSIGKAVSWITALWARFAAFVSTVPERIAIGFERVKLGFFQLGMGLLDTARQNPILGFLFGITGIDGALGKLQQAANQMDRALGTREARLTLQQAAATETDPRRQYQMYRQAAGDTPVTVNVTNNITSSDPQAAGAAAARGTGRAVQHAIPAGRRGDDAIQQAGGP